ncbi:MAG TPA: protein-L-isoaspartate(D-aspartate) O-methyltransferase [Candidatus Sulfotelmatobacter sp.]|jgi:protein-L-isoaspartate(D-aspartate) O-methyltransferase
MSESKDAAAGIKKEYDPLPIPRQEMVAQQLRDRGISDQRVLDAMLRVPRHEFMPEQYREQAYEDHPLPIGEGQTISQPYIVASMLEALSLRPIDNVLEVGSGSGYVTALLAELASQVFAIERHAVLATRARETIAKLGYRNVEIAIGDGSQGLPQHQPFDAIIVSAAAARVPAPLLAQLAKGGRMIIPVGAADAQQLQLIRMQDGIPQISLREPCRFVPLIAD